MLGPLVPLGTPDDGTCDCMWGQNKCPNQAAKVLKNQMNDGFMIACDVHTELYLRDYGDDGVDILDYNPQTVIEFTALAKMAGLN
ncbi:MAG: hypothetical protein MOB07_31450 [Acidobacteria bacterium]|nr:hypothetical protein [Acidobacteriota bacterium]